MANKRFYADLRRMAKAANQRMVRLEKAGINSPAYQAAQAKLEIMGKQTSGDRGRRFSESGKATYNEMEIMKKVLESFLYDDTTSTVSGAIKYQEDVWNKANDIYDLDKAGITREEWGDFWESMGSKKDRLYGSEQIIAIVRAYSMQGGELRDESRMSMEEIAEEIQSSKNLKSAYKALGLTSSDVIAAKITRD